MVDKHGHAKEVPAVDVAAAKSQGWREEADAEHIGRVNDALKEDIYGGTGGKVVAGGMGLLRGATLGGSDLVGAALGMSDQVRDVRDVNPGISTVTNVIGAVAPTILSGGTAAPAGMVSKLGARIAESGGGTLARATLGGAFEGAAQNTGAYISDVALGDRDLSAEGFLGAAGSGALFGGGATAALKLSSKALAAAKGLFPAKAVADIGDTFGGGETPSIGIADEPAIRSKVPSLTADAHEVPLSSQFAHGDGMKQAADDAMSQASDTLGQHMGDTDEMLATAWRKVEQAKQIEDMRFGNYKGYQTPEADLGQKISRIEQMDAAPTKAAFKEPAAPAMDSAGIGRGAQPGELGGATLEEQLAQTHARMNGGESFQGIGEGARLDVETQKLADAAEGMSRSHEELKALLAGEHEAKFVGAESIDDKIKRAMEELAPLRQGIPSHVTPEAVPLDINAALKASLVKHAEDPMSDIGQKIDVLGRHEEAHAKLVDALGPEAPPSAQARAQAWHEKLDQQLSKQDAQIGLGVSDFNGAIEPEKAIGAESAVGKAKGVLGMAADVATAAHLIHQLGIPGVPDPSAIPVIGPVLGVYLKARAMMMVAKRMGMKIPATAEAVIAGKAAQTQQRIQEAVKQALDVGSKATNAAASKVAQPAAILSHVLFADKSPRVTPPDQRHLNEDEKNLADRREELARAMQPGAVEAAIRQQVRASDPALVAAISDATQRKLQYLNSIVPKPPVLPGMMAGAVAEWHPAPGQTLSFARSMQAADDPASVFETLASGKQPTFEATEALRNVYPRLFEQAQQQVLMRAQDQTKPLPYARRVTLSVLFRVPLDGTMQPGYASAMAASYQAPQGQPQGSAPPSPGMTGDVTLGARSANRLDQR